tara:strand:- start:717 stop:842 length:126 start_codon:yes stop_codon:yes gene_type:complete
MALKKAHKEMLKGAGVTVAFAVFMQEQWLKIYSQLSQMVGK